MHETNINSICFPIYSLRLAGFLMQKGYILIDIKDHRNLPGRKVFYFKDTPQIRDSMREYSNNKIENKAV